MICDTFEVGVTIVSTNDKWEDSIKVSRDFFKYFFNTISPQKSIEKAMLFVK